MDENKKTRTAVEMIGKTGDMVAVCNQVVVKTELLGKIKIKPSGVSNAFCGPARGKPSML
jgi:hypothetical protein